MGTRKSAASRDFRSSSSTPLYFWSLIDPIQSRVHTISLTGFDVNRPFAVALAMGPLGVTSSQSGWPLKIDASGGGARMPVEASGVSL
jgi:hypothetical protein